MSAPWVSLTVLALDNALRSTGWATFTSDPPATEVGVWTNPVHVGRRASHALMARRVREYERWLASRLTEAEPDLAIIEGYSYASPYVGHQLGELGWACRRLLIVHDVPYAVATPKQRAKYATGKGNASKEAVLAAAIRRLDYAGHNVDEADALWLLEMACDAYVLGHPRVPQSHRPVLDTIVWPGPTVDAVE